MSQIEPFPAGPFRGPLPGSRQHQAELPGSKTNERGSNREHTPENVEREARIIQEMGAVGVLIGVAGKNFGSTVSPGAFKIYRDNLLAVSGNPTDPIEIMLIEQLTWAHHRLGTLHCQAVEAKSVEATAVYDAAAAKLMAEFRKMAVALREYRSPLVPKQVTVVQQQNVAGGDQQIALVDGTTRSQLSEKSADTKVPSKPELLKHVDHADPFAATDRRTPEPVKARTVNASRSAAAT